MWRAELSVYVQRGEGGLRVFVRGELYVLGGVIPKGMVRVARGYVLGSKSGEGCGYVRGVGGALLLWWLWLKVGEGGGG